MNDFVQFMPIKASKERERKFWAIRKENEKIGIGKTEIVTLKKACAATQAQKDI